jgi:hypothetical protein
MVAEGKVLPRYSGEGWSLRLDALGRIQLTFVGPTKTDAMVACLDALSSVMRERTDLIIDIRELDGHNIDTRDLWKVWLSKHKRDVRSVIVVLKRAMALHRMVTAAVGLAVGIRIEVTEQVP